MFSYHYIPFLQHEPEFDSSTACRKLTTSSQGPIYRVILSPHRITCSERVRAIPEHLARSAVCSSILEHTSRLVGRSVDVGTNLLGPDAFRCLLNWAIALVTQHGLLYAKTIAQNYQRASQLSQSDHSRTYLVSDERILIQYDNVSPTTV